MRGWRLIKTCALMILLIPFALIAAILSACRPLSNDWYWEQRFKDKQDDSGI